MDIRKCVTTQSSIFSVAISLLSLVLLVVVAAYLGFDLIASINQILSINPLFLLTLFIITFVELIFKTLRFHSSLNTKINFVALMRSYFLSVFVSFLVPFRLSGEGVRPFVFKLLNNIDYTHSFSAISIERIMDILFLSLILTTALAAINPLIPLIIFAALLAFLVIARTNTLILFSRRVPHNKVSSFMEGVFTELRHVITHKKRLATISFLTIIIWILAFFRFWLIIQSIGGNIGFLEASSASAFTYLFSLLSILPGGLIAFEGGGTAALLYLGLDHTHAISTIFLERIFTYWLFILGGIALLPHLNLKDSRAMKSYKHHTYLRTIIV